MDENEDRVLDLRDDPKYNQNDSHKLISRNLTNSQNEQIYSTMNMKK
jgi:hypothetical protein